MSNSNGPVNEANLGPSRSGRERRHAAIFGEMMRRARILEYGNPGNLHIPGAPAPRASASAAASSVASSASSSAAPGVSVIPDDDDDGAEPDVGDDDHAGAASSSSNDEDALPVSAAVWNSHFKASLADAVVQDERVASLLKKRPAVSAAAAAAAAAGQDEPSFAQYDLAAVLQHAVDYVANDTFRFSPSSRGVIIQSYTQHIGSRPDKSKFQRMFETYDNAPFTLARGDTDVQLQVCRDNDRVDLRRVGDVFILDLETHSLRLTPFIREIACLCISPGQSGAPRAFRSPVAFYRPLPPEYDAVAKLTEQDFEQQVMRLARQPRNKKLFAEADLVREGYYFEDVMLQLLDFIAPDPSDPQADEKSPLVLFQGYTDASWLVFNLFLEGLVDAAKQTAVAKRLEKIKPRFASVYNLTETLQHALNVESIMRKPQGGKVSAYWPYRGGKGLANVFKHMFFQKESDVRLLEAADDSTDAAARVAIADFVDAFLLAQSATAPPMPGVLRTVNQGARGPFGLSLPYLVEKNDCLHHAADADVLALYNVLAAQLLMIELLAQLQPHIANSRVKLLAHDDIEWTQVTHPAFNAVQNETVARLFFYGVVELDSVNDVTPAVLSEKLSTAYPRLLRFFFKRCVAFTNKFQDRHLPLPRKLFSFLLVHCTGAPLVAPQVLEQCRRLETYTTFLYNSMEDKNLTQQQLFLEDETAVSELQSRYIQPRQLVFLSPAREEEWRQASQSLLEGGSNGALQVLYNYYASVNAAYGRPWDDERVLELVYRRCNWPLFLGTGDDRKLHTRFCHTFLTNIVCGDNSAAADLEVVDPDKADYAIRMQRHVNTFHRMTVFTSVAHQSGALHRDVQFCKVCKKVDVPSIIGPLNARKINEFAYLAELPDFATWAARHRYLAHHYKEVAPANLPQPVGSARTFGVHIPSSSSDPDSHRRRVSEQESAPAVVRVSAPARTQVNVNVLRSGHGLLTALQQLPVRPDSDDDLSPSDAWTQLYDMLSSANVVLHVEANGFTMTSASYQAAAKLVHRMLRYLEKGKAAQAQLTQAEQNPLLYALAVLVVSQPRPSGVVDKGDFPLYLLARVLVCVQKGLVKISYRTQRMLNGLMACDSAMQKSRAVVAVDKASMRLYFEHTSIGELGVLQYFSICI